MLIIQEQQKRECADGLCPPGIEEVKDIVLTPLEKKAIFFCLKKHIDAWKNALAE